MHIDEMAHPLYNDTCEGQCCAARPEDLDVCCEGGDGGMLLPMFGDAEQRWPKGLRGLLYLIGMLWCFLGVAIIADLFMGAAASHLSAPGGLPFRNSRPVIRRGRRARALSLCLATHRCNRGDYLEDLRED